jgi:hypothetical protein
MVDDNDKVRNPLNKIKNWTHWFDDFYIIFYLFCLPTYSTAIESK